MKRFAIATVAAIALLTGVAAAKEVQVATNGQPAAVHQNLVRAAHDVCFADAVNRMTFQERRMRNRCVQETVNDAVAATGNPAIAAIHEGLGARERYALIRGAERTTLAANRGGAGASAGSIDLNRTAR